MKSLIDREGALSRGLADIRTQFAVPAGFPAEVEAEAEEAAARAVTDHADWTAREFVTLDPATSTDLDQAFAIERSGGDLILYMPLPTSAGSSTLTERSTARRGTGGRRSTWRTERRASIRSG